MAPMRSTKLWFSLACLLPVIALAACSARRTSTEERAEVVRPQPAAAAPATAQPFTVLLDTTKGPIHIEVHPEWAPLGAARGAELGRAAGHRGLGGHRGGSQRRWHVPGGLFFSMGWI